MGENRINKLGNFLLGLTASSLTLILFLLAVCAIFDMTLIYDNVYLILGLLSILFFMPAILFKTRKRKGILRVVACFTVGAVIVLLCLFMFFITRLGGEITLKPSHEIVYSVEEGQKIVELSRHWTFFMEEHGGMEYKKAYVKFLVFYDNNLIEQVPAFV